MDRRPSDTLKTRASTRSSKPRQAGRLSYHNQLLQDSALSSDISCQRYAAYTMSGVILCNSLSHRPQQSCSSTKPHNSPLRIAQLTESLSVLCSTLIPKTAPRLAWIIANMRWLKFLSQERVYVRQPSRHYRFCRCYRCLNATRGGGHGRRSAYKPKPDGHGAGRHPGMSIIATTIGASALADQFHPPPVPPPPTSKSKTVPPPPPAPAPFSIVSTVNQFGIK